MRNVGNKSIIFFLIFDEDGKRGEYDARKNHTGISTADGTPLSLKLDGSPAVRVGAGFHAKATEGGLSVNLEGGWKWDTGDFRMRIQGQPDRRGEYDLSGTYFLFGITLRP